MLEQGRETCQSLGQAKLDMGLRVASPDTVREFLPPRSAQRLVSLALRESTSMSSALT